MDSMTTVSEVLNKLKEEGYELDFNLENNCLVCSGNSLQISPDEFVVDEHYRFEGISDPGDEAVVYAISSPKYHSKGTLGNGYGIYGDTKTDEIIKALRKKSSGIDTKIPESRNFKRKFNDATPRRPKGNRPLDASLVEMDIAKFKEQIKQEAAWRENDRNAITIFKTNGMRIVLVGLKTGAVMKTHTAAGIISVQVLEGKINFNTAERAVDLGIEQMLALHADIPHNVKAREESFFLLTLTTALEK